MKVLFTLFGLMLFVEATAQNWQFVQPGQKVYFINGCHYLRGMRIDTIQAVAGATILSPYRSPRGFYDNNQLLDTNGGSWLGKKIIQQPNGDNLFLNGWSDTVLIKTTAGVGSTWPFYNDASAIYYTATVQSAGVATIAGLSDSVKTITIQAMQGGIQLNGDLANQCSIILSKNHGLQRAFDFYTFPYHPPTTTGAQLHFDYFFDAVNKGLGNRSGTQIVSDSAKMVFTRIILQNATNSDYGNFLPGDVLQYYKVGFGGPPQGSGQDAYFIISTDTILTKQITAGIPQYTTGRKVTEYITQPGPPYWQTTSNSNDAIDLTAPYWFFAIDTVLMPEETHNRYFYSYDPDDTTFCTTGRVFGRLDNDFQTNATHVNTFEPCGWYRWLKAGIGIIDIDGCDDPDYSEDFEVSLIYLNRNSAPCGTQSSLSVPAHLPQALVKIFPNPTSSALTIQLPEALRAHENTIIITDLTGGVRYKAEHVSTSGIIIDIRSWPAGIYILRLHNNNEVLTRKIIVQH